MLFTEAQFTCLADKYIDTVFRVALNYVKDPADAEDVTQSVFEKLLRQREPFESEAHIRHWLIRVAIGISHIGFWYPNCFHRWRQYYIIAYGAVSEQQSRWEGACGNGYYLFGWVGVFHLWRKVG